MYCNNCGAELIEGSAFCNKCGCSCNLNKENINTNTNSNSNGNSNRNSNGNSTFYFDENFDVKLNKAISKMNVLAIISFVLGILSVGIQIFIYIPILNIPAIICSVISLAQISTNKSQTGKEFAISGLILAIIGILIFIVVIAIILFAYFLFSASHINHFRMW